MSAGAGAPATGGGVRVTHLTTTHDAFDTRVFHKECRTLSAAGYDVTLVVPHTGDETRDSVRVRAVPLPASRSVRATRSAWQVFRTGLATGARVYHLHDPELIPYGLALKLLGRRVIYDIHENLAKDVRSKHYLPVPVRLVLGVVVAWLERGACACFDGVVAATPGIAERYPWRRTFLVRNFPLMSEFPEACATPHAERPPAIVYIGGLNWIRGLREMVQAVGLLDPALGAELRLAVRFDPPGLEREVAGEPGWARTVCLPWGSRQEVARTLGAARVGVLAWHPVPNHLDSLPVKMFEYMAAGLPIVASRFPAWQEVLGEGGLYVEPFDAPALAQAIAGILRCPEEGQRRGAIGRAAIEREYHWEREAVALLACYRRVAGPARAAGAER